MFLPHYNLHIFPTFLGGCADFVHLDTITFSGMLMFIIKFIFDSQLLMLGFYFFGNLHLLFKYHKSGVSENTVAEQNVSVQCHFNFLLSLICVPFQRLMETPLWLFVKVIILIQTSRSVYKRVIH